MMPQSLYVTYEILVKKNDENLAIYWFRELSGQGNRIRNNLSSYNLLS